MVTSHPTSIVTICALYFHHYLEVSGRNTLSIKFGIPFQQNAPVFLFLAQRLHIRSSDITF